MTATRFGPLLAPVIISIIRAERQMVPFVIVRTISFRKPQHVPRHPNRVAPACARVKVLA